jgi:hypothetical protein
MRRLWLLAFVLLFGVGCTEADRAQWDEAMRDARGDNMKMGSGNTTPRSGSLQP